MHKPMIRAGKHKLKRVFTMDEVVDEILNRVLDKHHLLNVRSKKEVYVVTSRELRELIKEITGVEVRPSYHVQRYLNEELRKRGYRIVLKRRNNKFVKFIIAKDGVMLEELNVG
jgi:hypothetical protein